MSDNPFSEPDDSDRTVIRPAPGGRRPAAHHRHSLHHSTAFGVPERAGAARARRADAGGRRGTHQLRSQPADRGRGPAAATAGPPAQHLRQPDPGELRERAIQQVRAFEQAARDGGVPMDQLRPAHYALCASLDDVVLNTPWGSSGAWAARSMVSTFHQEVRSGERFFELLDQLKPNPGNFLPVLELMYLCLSLGFQGQYRLSPRGPGELDRIREDLYTIIIAPAAGGGPGAVAALAGRPGALQAGTRRGADMGDGCRGAGGHRDSVRVVLHRAECRVGRCVRRAARRAAVEDAGDHPRRAGEAATATTGARRHPIRSTCS